MTIKHISLRELALVTAVVFTTATPAFALQQSPSPPILLNAITACAPNVDPGIIAGIVSRETSVSPFQPLTATSSNLWQINDNTAKRSFAFPNYAIASEVTADLVYHQHHTVAIGIGQILSDNIKAYKVTVADAFQPCTNLSLAQRVLRWAYLYAINALHIQPGLGATHLALQIYYAGIKNQRYAAPDAVAYASDVINRASVFNQYIRSSTTQQQQTILPMPENPWPAGANRIPVAISQTSNLTHQPATPSSHTQRIAKHSPPAPHPTKTPSAVTQAERIITASFRE